MAGDWSGKGGLSSTYDEGADGCSRPWFVTISSAESNRSTWRSHIGVVKAEWHGRIVSLHAASGGPPGKRWSGEADRGAFTRAEGRAFAK